MIDDKLPCVVLSNKKAVPMISRSAYENEFWPSLIEKAYAKLNGSFASLENKSLREIINDFTGLEPEIINFINKDFLNTDNFMSFL